MTLIICTLNLIFVRQLVQKLRWRAHEGNKKYKILDTVEKCHLKQWGVDGRKDLRARDCDHEVDWTSHDSNHLCIFVAMVMNSRCSPLQFCLECHVLLSKRPSCQQCVGWQNRTHSYWSWSTTLCAWRHTIVCRVTAGLLWEIQRHGNITP